MRIACVMMQRNEDLCLEPWVRYHGYLFGFENIFIIDHNSDSRKVLSLLRQYEEAGVSVTRLPPDADYKDKGRFVAEEINRVDALAKFDFVFPIDCDEFLFLKKPDGTPTCSRIEIHDYLKQFQDFPGLLEIKENFLHILGHPGYFWSQPYQKVFFAGGNCALLDHGSHTGVSRLSSQRQETSLVYAHFHFKPYNIDREMARMKLAPWVDVNDLDALQDFKGPGQHLVGHLLKTEEEYEAGFTLTKDSIYFNDLMCKFFLTGIDKNFSSIYVFDGAPLSIYNNESSYNKDSFSIINSAILIRTNFYDEELGKFAYFLQQDSKTDVIFVTDDRFKITEIPVEFKKISLTESFIEEMNLLNIYDSGWRCGDYFLYAAKKILPNCEFFWMVEPDVYMNFNNLSEFFNVFKSESNVDLIAAEISLPDTDWFWRYAMEPFNHNIIMRCFYPIVRLSARAIDYLYQKRTEMVIKFEALKSLHPEKISDYHWPNDEVFTATLLHEAGFVCRDINSFGIKMYDSEVFRFGWPFSFSEIKNIPKDNKLYHPVPRGMEFVDKAIVRLHHDVRSNFGYNYIMSHYTRKEFMNNVAKESGREGVEKLESNLSVALQNIKDQNSTMNRNDIVQKVWRGNDPLEEFIVDEDKFDPQGWNSGHPYLTEAIGELSPKIIVEVGVWKGGSVLAMAEYLKSNNINSTIIAVDTWLGSWDHWESDHWFGHLSFKNGYPTMAWTFMNNVVSSGFSDVVVPLPIDSINAAHILGHFHIFPMLIHLDGGHDYQAVMSDLEKWWPLLHTGGILIGDDYRTDGSWPEVRQAFDDFVLKHKIEGVEHMDGKCRLRKIAN